MRNNYKGEWPGTYTITKQFKFEAAHRLENLPKDHKCSRDHGHSFRVEIVVEAGKLDKRGFVADYAEFDFLKRYINDYLDHRDLNQVFNFQTSAENLARHIFDWCKVRLPQVCCIRVSETQSTWAEFRFGGS